MPPKRGNGKRRKAVHPSPNEAEVSSQRSLRTRTVTIKEKKAVQVRLRSSMMVDKEEEKPAHDSMLKQVCGLYLSPERASNLFSGRPGWPWPEFDIRAQ
jgi:hypothetical protein